MSIYKKEIKQAMEIKDWLIKIRRDFHQNPELSMEEYRTKNKIINYLKEIEINNISEITNTGVVAMIEGKNARRTVALRADMDALPMQDYKEVGYRSKVQGKMHACGHDAHMAIVLGTAKLLNGIKENLNGNVKLIFQPAEEAQGGAKRMIDEGVLESPKVDVIFALHVSPEIPRGKIGVRYGQMTAASDSFSIRIQGKSSHGAYPHNGVDAILIASHIIIALQSIVSRKVDPRDSAVITIGTIRGGERGNIVANQVDMEGTIRTLNKETKHKVLKELKKIVTQTANAMGGKADVNLKEGYISLINDNKIVDMIKNNAIDLLGKNQVIEIEKASLGVEDFAYFLDVCPGAYFRLGCSNLKKGVLYDVHTNNFDIDEDCLPIGVALQLKNVLSYLGV